MSMTNDFSIEITEQDAKKIQKGLEVFYDSAILRPLYGDHLLGVILFMGQEDFSTFEPEFAHLKNLMKKPVEDLTQEDWNFVGSLEETLLEIWDKEDD